MLENMYLKPSRLHVLVGYLSAELNTPDDLRRYNTHVHIYVWLMHNVAVSSFDEIISLSGYISVNDA